ncbi:MAG: CapA family protein [Mesorhizobium sp.]|uniref:CapA family protein n=1 Tax=Mesorhizobium sp. TaxID=1871066 RepID=UPI000FE8D832|nr:CapA family protein [Mesorhizobium sp.]RWB14360.1 MAG: CapA family protein [Mesorhizobium sp.]
MAIGSVYIWEECDSEFSGGRLRYAEVELPYLSHRKEDRGLYGQFVDVTSHERRREPQKEKNSEVRSDKNGDYIFKPARGGLVGGRRGLEAARCFGQVNVYYHLSLIAQQMNWVLRTLGERPLPKIRAVVGPHQAGPTSSSATSEDFDGLFFTKGIQYRCPASPDVVDRFSISGCAELLFGQADAIETEGWLSKFSGGPYLCDPSHDPGIIYRAYGLHVVRHTADVQARRLRISADKLSNLTGLECALSAYFAGSMLSTSYTSSWRRRHDAEHLLADALSNDYCFSGSRVRSEALIAQVMGGALWDLHKALAGNENVCLVLVVAALLLLGGASDSLYAASAARTRAIRSAPENFAACLLHADTNKYGGRHETLIRDVFSKRGLGFSSAAADVLSAPSVPPFPRLTSASVDVQRHVEGVRRRYPEVIIPNDTDFMDPERLELLLSSSNYSSYHLAAVGDIMTGMRMRSRIRKFGPDYCFAWVKPVFRRCSLITGNLEAPFATSERLATTRKFSYRVEPRSASVLRRAGFSAVSIANNHIQDCGRVGVLETLDTLERHHMRAFGGGRNQSVAHDPAIYDGVDLRIGLLAYCWYPRTAARGDLPGSARDLPELVERDLKRLRPLVDRIAVMVHWGTTYERQPTDQNRTKARMFIDFGADVVIGHHPHIVQPIEIYNGRPILYSVGNFAFGSGHNKAESILSCFSFGNGKIDLDIYPICVQNRDPRVDYQPKIIGGSSGRETLARLLAMSPDLAPVVSVVNDECLRLSIPSGRGQSSPAAVSRAERKRKSARP